MSKKDNLLFEQVKILLSKKKIDLWVLIKGLECKYIRGSGKGWQKRNKTSSTVQLIDKFNYLKIIPEENKHLYKGFIVIKMDMWRSQITNYQYAISEWLKLLKKYFTVSKTRTIDFKKEKNRKDKLSKIYKDKKQNDKYRNRFS